MLWLCGRSKHRRGSPLSLAQIQNAQQHRTTQHHTTTYNAQHTSTNRHHQQPPHLGAERERRRLLGARARDHKHLAAKRDAKLDGHVAQAAEPHDADLQPRLVEAVEDVGRVGGDARAQQRRDAREVELVRHRERVRLVADDVRRVAALRLDAVLVHGVVREHALGAELVLAGLAQRAAAARLHIGADAGAVADLELGHFGADGGDDADDLVPRHDGVPFLLVLFYCLFDVIAW